MKNLKFKSTIATVLLSGIFSISHAPATELQSFETGKLIEKENITLGTFKKDDVKPTKDDGIKNGLEQFGFFDSLKRKFNSNDLPSKNIPKLK